MYLLKTWGAYLVLTPPPSPHLSAACNRSKEGSTRALQLIERYNAHVYRGPMGPFVGLLLMVRSGFLVGNPASSLSASAARVRYAMRPSDPATTIVCGGFPGPDPKDPAQC